MRLSLFSAALLCGTSAFAFAQDTSNLEKLSNFQTTGTTEFTFIDQTGANADAISRRCKRSSCRQVSRLHCMPWCQTRVTWQLARRAS